MSDTPSSWTKELLIKLSALAVVAVIAVASAQVMINTAIVAPESSTTRIQHVTIDEPAPPAQKAPEAQRFTMPAMGERAYVYTGMTHADKPFQSENPVTCDVYETSHVWKIRMLPDKSFKLLPSSTSPSDDRAFYLSVSSADQTQSCSILVNREAYATVIKPVFEAIRDWSTRNNREVDVKLTPITPFIMSGENLTAQPEGFTLDAVSPQDGVLNVLLRIDNRN